MEIGIKDQLMEVIEDFGEEVPNSVTLTPAKHPLQVNDNTIQFDGYRSDVFHSVTTNILYIMKR